MNLGGEREGLDTGLNQRRSMRVLDDLARRERHAKSIRVDSVGDKLEPSTDRNMSS